LLILRKPFGTIEVRQLANSLTAKWHLTRQADLQAEDLSTLVEQRTVKLRDMNVQLQRDIVRRREVEQQLARAAEELTRTNQELAQTNAELSEARDQALASVKTKSEFLAVMSHELRSPLSVIIGYTSLTLERTFGELSDSQVSVMQKIDRHARNLHKLIDSQYLRQC
jgi:signal transduction histidine kinase